MSSLSSSARSSMTTEATPAGCVAGTTAAGSAAACAGCPSQGECSANAKKNVANANDAKTIQSALSDVKHKLLVLSGKGGVGKSTCASQIALTLASRGASVGVLDVDICGPSIPRMLGCAGREVHQSASGWSPVYVSENLAVMSVAFMLPTTDDAVVWRGPRKNGLIKQFLTDVDWGQLDYLIIDTPPGTSDEHISVIQYLKEAGVDGALVVTTPEEVSMADVRKELNFCVKTKVPVIGVIENMGHFRTDLKKAAFYDDKGRDMSIFVQALLEKQFPNVTQVGAEVFTMSNGGPQEMAEKFNVPYLGSLPLDPKLLAACEEGECFVEKCPESLAAKGLNKIADKIVEKFPHGA